MMETRIICIECPMGCEVCVKDNNGELITSGNNCPRGEAYAKAEVITPRRVLTSTIKLSNGKMLAVKTDKAIKKVNMFDIMQKINACRLDDEFSQGDIVIKNIEDDINLIATSNSY